MRRTAMMRLRPGCTSLAPMRLLTFLALTGAAFAVPAPARLLQTAQQTETPAPPPSSPMPMPRPRGCTPPPAPPTS